MLLHFCFLALASCLLRWRPELPGFASGFLGPLGIGIGKCWVSEVWSVRFGSYVHWVVCVCWVGLCVCVCVLFAAPLRSVVSEAPSRPSSLALSGLLCCSLGFRSPLLIWAVSWLLPNLSYLQWFSEHLGFSFLLSSFLSFLGWDCHMDLNALNTTRPPPREGCGKRGE